MESRQDDVRRRRSGWGVGKTPPDMQAVEQDKEQPGKDEISRNGSLPNAPDRLHFLLGIKLGVKPVVLHCNITPADLQPLYHKAARRRYPARN